MSVDFPQPFGPKIETIRLEQSKWDVLLSQNHHSSVILASAYDWHRTLFEEGYPRNDPLTSGSPYAGDGTAIRAQLGIKPELSAVLFDLFTHQWAELTAGKSLLLVNLGHHLRVG